MGTRVWEPLISDHIRGITTHTPSSLIDSSVYGEVPGQDFWWTVVVVHLLSPVWLFVIPWTAACQAPLLFTVSWSLFKFMSIKLVMLSNHLILWCPLLVPSIFPRIRVFSNESALCIRWPKCWISASVLVFPMHVQVWFPLRLTGLISLQSKGLSRVFSSTTIWKHQFFIAQPSLWSHMYYMVQIWSHICTWLLKKP